MVKMLIVLVSRTISNSQVFLLKKNVSSFCNFCKCKSDTHFSAKILAYMPYLAVQSFNDTLTNDIVSFEQVGPDQHRIREVLSESSLGEYQKMQSVFMWAAKILNTLRRCTG